MRPSLCLAFCLLVSGPAYAVEIDPAKLKPTTEQIAKAEGFAARLGSDIFHERDTASRELAGMGRLALSVIERVLAETDDAEVRSRCEALRPSMQDADLKARLETFIADADGKYDHKLPAWDKFKAIVGNTTDTRKLFTQLYEYVPTAKLLMASTGNKEDFTALVMARRMEIYNRMNGRFNRIGGGAIVTSERVPPTLTDAVGQLFTESLVGSFNDRRYSYAITSMLQNVGIKDHLKDTAKGEPLRKIFAEWCDSRTEAVDIYSAMNLAVTMDVKDVPATKYAIKLLEQKALPTAIYKTNAIATLAKVGGREQLPVIVKQFDDKSNVNALFFGANGQAEQVAMQQRDIALAMAIAVTDQKAEDYGFTVRNSGDAMKFTYNNYRFPSEETRAEAFKKWDEWQAKNPLKK